VGHENPWASLYDPGRVRLGAAGAIVRENLTVARDLLDWVTPGTASSADAIPRGEGAVLREGLTKVAAYRDDDGALHRLSAVCPHLGCIVAWNGVERTWDCPCHGSRFEATGRVCNGPANHDLSPAD
jgi:Rieske Fe-S protein